MIKLKSVFSDSRATSLISGLIALLALWALVLSAQQFMAGNAYYSVKNSIEKWQRTPDQLSEEGVDNALSQINKAVSAFPNNAFYYQMRGQVFEWYSQTQYVSGQLPTNKQLDYLNEAFVNYEKSIQLRPNWSGSWVGLASIKWKKNELDEVFYQYLNMAIESGPQDAILHKFIVEFGLTMFNARSVHYVNVRDLLKKHLALGLANPLSRDFVLAVIARQRSQKVVCRWLNQAQYSIRKHIPGCVVFN